MVENFEQVADPRVGFARCGAFVALLALIPNPLTGRLASLIGAIKIAKRGAQNYAFTPGEIETLRADGFVARAADVEAGAADDVADGVAMTSVP